MRIGIIGSAGGSAFDEIVKILNEVSPGEHEFFVVTDRECSLELKCKFHKIPCKRIEDSDNYYFSEKAKKHFDQIGQIDFVLLFFSRLVTEVLFTNYVTFNIHPSLLPAFKGMSAARKMISSSVKFIGATLHLVDETIDMGPIIAQLSMPVSSKLNENLLNKYSFIHKVYLGLLAIELLETKSINISRQSKGIFYSKELPYTDRCNPSLANLELIQAVKRLQDEVNVEVIF
ncbi:formyltransferase family protein [Paenibacillus aestuarii]|uniref:phosphoribosylglycinamide formyltransferase 1 n=1 Tax=Paenibacillus aestuarii TaxID=516965 RepID=A0ABW0K5X6_9BACL|nr:formyltransferase family protein [Paenibacillus aestuarii]